MAIIITAYPGSLELTQGEHIVEGTVNAHDVQFVLPKGDSAWEGMTLVACFRSLLCERCVVLDFDTLSCKFPWEVNAEGSVGSPVSIGLYGAGDPEGKVVVRSTVWVDMPFRILPSTSDTAEPPDGPCEDGDMEPSREPTPSQYQQMLVAVSGVVQRMDELDETAEAVTQAADRVEQALAEWEHSSASGRFVVDTVTLFAMGDSRTTPPTEGWSETAPTWTEGKFLWQKVIVTYSDGTMRTTSVTCLTGAQGMDATTLLIDSSGGTVFKNSKIATTLTVTVYKGAKAINTLSELKREYGTGAYLEWSWKRLTDATFGVLLVTDHRISDDGFTFTISPGEVDRKVVLKCQLIT